MLNTIKVEVKPLEDLLASTYPEYLKSIREARADYEAGRVKSHEEVFGQ